MKVTQARAWMQSHSPSPLRRALGPAGCWWSPDSSNTARPVMRLATHRRAPCASSLSHSWERVGVRAGRWQRAVGGPH